MATIHHTASYPTAEQLIGYSVSELAKVDPVVLNLAVARGIPALADLEIAKYIQLADDWAADLKKYLKQKIIRFQREPKLWKNDVNFFKLGVICNYIESVLGIAYREDQRNAQLAGVASVFYTDPSDLFLNGVMDTRRGTCGNLAALNMVLGRRIGLPVTLTCAGSHFFVRYDDGFGLHYNIEATESGRGGFASPTDEEIRQHYKLPQLAIECGSELSSLNARELLGTYFGLRARHFNNTQRMEASEVDYLLARALFPKNRYLYVNQNMASVQLSMKMFEMHEKGHPAELSRWLQDVVYFDLKQKPQSKLEKKRVLTPAWRPHTITVSPRSR